MSMVANTTSVYHLQNDGKIYLKKTEIVTLTIKAILKLGDKTLRKKYRITYDTIYKWYKYGKPISQKGLDILDEIITDFNPNKNERVLKDTVTEYLITKGNPVHIPTLLEVLDAEEISIKYKSQ